MDYEEKWPKLRLCEDIDTCSFAEKLDYLANESYDEWLRKITEAFGSREDI